MSDNPQVATPQDQNLTNAHDTKPQGEVQPTATAPEKTGGKTFTQAELEQIIEERLEREKTKAAKLADRARQEAEAEAAKKNGEWEKLAKQREEQLAELQKAITDREAQIKAQQVATLKRDIAERLGLPTALASRLVGDDEKAIEADAKALLDTLPKPAPEQPKAKPQPGLAPVNPGANGQQGETLQQRRQRIHGVSPNPFDPAVARQHGGGAYFSEKGGGAKE